jgi:hypothetical protein
VAGILPEYLSPSCGFDAQSAEQSPETFVLSRNLRKRHLTIGQKAAIALE